MHLAKLMHRTVDELLDTMSYPELLRWGEYFTLFPEEGWRADARAAQICAIIANVNRDEKKKPEPYQIADFLLFDKILEQRRAERPPEPKVVEAAVAPPQGAKIAPETVAWLFGKARQTAALKESTSDH